jgi:hypothetical protein
VDNSFVDLDILTTKIREPRSRTYFLEAVKSYKAGALRSALSAAWIAVAYDSLLKYRELSAAGDTVATAFTQEWENAETHGDIRKLLELEGSIINHACQDTQLINGIGRTHLERLRQDRHLCSHPAFSTDAELFEPSAELVRLHLVNAVDLVLSQEPLQGKAILEQYHQDVKSIGFPDDSGRLADYVEQRYLLRVRPRQVKNFGVVLAKALLKTIPPDLDKFYDRVALSLQTTCDRAGTCWPDITSAIVRLLDNLEPAFRLRAIGFLASFPSFWNLIAPATRTVLLQTAQNIQATSLDYYRCLRAVELPQFSTVMTAVIDAMPEAKLREAMQVTVIRQFWPPSLSAYRDSGSFRQSEAHFKTLIQPFASALMLDATRSGELLQAVSDNGQNWDASETPRLLTNAIASCRQQDFPSRQARDGFYNEMRGYGRVQPYEDLWQVFARDGWTPPP